jgi:hypothetical protein
MDGERRAEASTRTLIGEMVGTTGTVEDLFQVITQPSGHWILLTRGCWGRASREMAVEVEHRRKRARWATHVKIERLSSVSGCGVTTLTRGGFQASESY